MAKFGIALGSGPRGLGFESRHSKGPMSLELEPTRDIAAELGKMKKNGQVLVGFALETDAGMDLSLIHI